MKRHDSFVAFSREHHFGLLFCWKIRQGVKMHIPTERIQPYIKYFWENHLQQHFKEEETLLFAVWQGSLVNQAQSEHQHIRQLVEDTTLKGSLRAEMFTVLADAVDAHIRFEERTLFPHLEQNLPADKLNFIGNQLHILHQTREKDEYPDEFWI